MDKQRELELWAKLNEARHLIEEVQKILVRPEELFRNEPGSKRLNDSSKNDLGGEKDEGKIKSYF